MKIWNIKIMKMGNAVVSAAQLGMISDDGNISVPTWATAVWDDHTKILVDTGVTDVDWVNRHDPVYEQKEEERLVNAMKRHLGWNPEDVEAVIHTHLHYDHCGNDTALPNAVFYVTKKEWETAHMPLPIHVNYYNRTLIDKNAINYFRWRFVEGEQEIYPGIAVIPTPGHAVGHQSVLISTKEGVVCVAGDVSPMADNLLKNTMPGISSSNEQILKSYQEIRMRAHYFIPGHEYTLKDGQTSDFIKIND